MLGVRYRKDEVGRHQQKAFVMTLSLFCVYNILGQGKLVLRLCELPHTLCCSVRET